jgi:hypothetical protein
MSVVRKIFDIFGQGDRKFYTRDFRNAYQFRPDINPPRQQFQGYVSFVLNRDLYEEFFKEQGQTFRLQIGSLVRKATFPSVDFKTETKNQYNRKKVVNITTEFSPVMITVMDTVSNEWLTLLMKYYTYHYMNARNEGGGSRDLGRAPDYVTGNDFINSQFGLNGNWDSNKAGYNPNITPYFFERIDYVLYHGNRGVQYSLLNPVLTSFKNSELDYSSSELMNFDLTFIYENFTVHNELNFQLSEFDVARFENAGVFTGPAFTEGTKAPAITTEPLKLDILGSSTGVNLRNRSIQPQPPSTVIEQQGTPTNSVPNAAGIMPSGTEVTRIDNDPENPLLVLPAVSVTLSLEEQQAIARAAEQKKNFPSTYGQAATFSNTTGLQKTSFLDGLLSNVADAALSSAINGTSIKDATLGVVIGGVLSDIEPRLRQVGQAAVRAAKAPVSETGGEPIQPPPVTPDGNG